MQKKFSIFLLVIVSTFFTGLPNAAAIGLGFYADLPLQDGSGDYTVEDDDSVFGNTNKFDSSADYSAQGLGFVLDTNTARDSLFNYRMNLGYEKLEMEDTKLSPGAKLNLDGWVLDNTFGFGVYRNRNIRVWLGPQIRLAYYNGDAESANGVTDPYHDYHLFAFGFAPVVGVNFNPGDLFTSSLTMGYRFTKYYGASEYNGPNSQTDVDQTIEADEGRLFINLSVLFRINDTF